MIEPFGGSQGVASHRVPKDTIAVFGGASLYTETQVVSGFEIGREIARRGKTLLTGATLGIPYSASIGAKLEGGTVVGISPAASMEEHVSLYKRPLDYMDVVIYTGMGLEGRNAINVRSARGAIFVAGEFGTLNEFSAAWTTGNNVLGVLEGVGGISAYIQDVVEQVKSNYGSIVVFDRDPVELARLVCLEVDRRFSVRVAFESSSSLGGDVKEIVHRHFGPGARGRHDERNRRLH